MRKVNMQQSLRLGLIRSISLHPTIWNQAIADPKNETKHRGQYAWLSTKGQFLIQKKIRYWCPWKIFWIKSIWIILSPLSLTQISKSAWTKKNLKKFSPKGNVPRVYLLGSQDLTPMNMWGRFHWIGHLIRRWTKMESRPICLDARNLGNSGLGLQIRRILKCRRKWILEYI